MFRCAQHDFSALGNGSKGIRSYEVWHFPLRDTAQAGDDDRAHRPVPGYFDCDFSFAAEDAKGLAGLEASESVADTHAALAEVHQVSMEFVGARVRFERDFYLPFGWQTGLAAAIGKDRGIGGDQFNPVSLITHGLKQSNAGYGTPQSTFVTMDEWTEVTLGIVSRERPVCRSPVCP